MTAPITHRLAIAQELRASLAIVEKPFTVDEAASHIEAIKSAEKK